MSKKVSKKKGLDLKWWILITVIIGTFLGRLDQTIVNLALPKIINDFSITVSAAAWIGTAYIIANAVFVPIWGKLGDTIGRKKVYIIGFGVFILGSALAGLAWNLTSMVVFRVIQAIAGSADYPTAMAIIAVTFKEGKERAEALGIWSVSFAAASVFGPLLGGPLIDTFGWRSVFLINIPIGIIGIVMAMLFIEESKSEKNTLDSSFDWWGAVLLGIGLSSLILVLDKGLEWGWISGNSLLMYLITIVFLYWFYKNEINHSDPLVDFKFFKIPVFNGAIINNFLVFMAMIGALFALPIFTSEYMGYNATESGLLFIPMAVCMVLASIVGGRLLRDVKPHIMISISTLIAAIGIYLFAIFLDPRSTALDVMIPLAVMAFGMGLAMSHRTNAIASAVSPSEIGVASSVLALARNIAGAFGIAIFATILTNTTENAVISLSQNSIIHSTNSFIIAQASGLMILKAQMIGYTSIFYVASVILFIGAIMAFFVKSEKKTDIKVHVE